MSGSETGLIFSANIAVPRPLPPQGLQPAIHNMRLSYTPDGTAVYEPLTGGSPSPSCQPASENGCHADAGNSNFSGLSMSVNVSIGEPMVKKKRGRPRKYWPDGSMGLSLSSTQSPASVVRDSQGGFSPSILAPPPQQSTVPFSTSVGSGGGNGDGDVLPSLPSMGVKKPRGRPPGSGKKKQFAAIGSVGIGFTPHVITVKTGEDVSSKIMSFSQSGPRAVCILSANGAISNVTLWQAATSGGTVTYEGRFEILSLSGLFMMLGTGGQRSRTGGLSVSIAGPDGRVFGGGVAGLLIAGSPVQVVVGSFVPEGGLKQPMPLEANQMEAFAASHGTMSESSGGGSGSPLNHQEYLL